MKPQESFDHQNLIGSESKWTKCEKIPIKGSCDILLTRMRWTQGDNDLDL